MNQLLIHPNFFSRGDGAEMYGMGGPGGYHHRSDSPMSGYHPPARSPTGSHSTPSPHSQVIDQSQALDFYWLITRLNIAIDPS